METGLLSYIKPKNLDLSKFTEMNEISGIGSLYLNLGKTKEAFLIVKNFLGRELRGLWLETLLERADVFEFLPEFLELVETIDNGKEKDKIQRLVTISLAKNRHHNEAIEMADSLNSPTKPMVLSIIATNLIKDKQSDQAFELVEQNQDKFFRVFFLNASIEHITSTTDLVRCYEIARQMNHEDTVYVQNILRIIEKLAQNQEFELVMDITKKIVTDESKAEAYKHILPHITDIDSLSSILLAVNSIKNEKLRAGLLPKILERNISIELVNSVLALIDEIPNLKLRKEIRLKCLNSIMKNGEYEELLKIISETDDTDIKQAILSEIVKTYLDEKILDQVYCAICSIKDSNTLNILLAEISDNSASKYWLTWALTLYKHLSETHRKSVF